MINLGLPPHILSAVDLSSPEVQTLLKEEIQNAGGDSVVKKHRASNGVNVVDIISPSVGFSLFKQQLDFHRQTALSKQDANNQAWQKLVDVDQNFANEVASFRTLVGDSFDWLEVDWATLGRAIGSAIAEVMSAPPYNAQISKTHDFSISHQLMQDLREEQPQLGGQLSAKPTRLFEHGGRNDSATEASLVRAGAGVNPVFCRPRF